MNRTTGISSVTPRQARTQPPLSALSVACGTHALGSHVADPLEPSRPATRKRVRIRDHAHAVEIARSLLLDERYKRAGLTQGFADWLYLYRDRFNASNPLQQVRVYIGELESLKPRGVDIDEVNADLVRSDLEFSRWLAERHEHASALLQEMWERDPLAPQVTAAVASLLLGRGLAFAVERGVVMVEKTAPSQVIVGLRALFARIDGPDEEWPSDSLGDLEGRRFDRYAKAAGHAMLMTANGFEPSDNRAFGSLANIVTAMSDQPFIRESLRRFQAEAEMKEVILHALKDSRFVPPPRRNRSV